MRMPRLNAMTLSFVYLLLIICFARLSNSAEMLTKNHFKIVVHDQKITVGVDAGFHLNTKAPATLKMMSATSGDLKPSAESNTENIQKTLEMEPSVKLENQFVFNFKGEFRKEMSKKIQKGKLNFYICDNANTVCEEHTEEVTLPKVKMDKSVQNHGSTELENKTKATHSKVKFDANGFIINDIRLAMENAKKFNKLILVDFGASWCPPCIRLEHEVFNSKEFQKFKKQFVFVRLDVDDIENQEWVQKFNIKAYPSLVILDANENEQKRWVDYLPKEILTAKLKTFIGKNRPESIEAIKQASFGGKSEATLKLAEHYCDSMEHQKCIDTYDKIKLKPFRYFNAKIYLTQKEMDASEGPHVELEKKLMQIFREGIATFPDSYLSVDWRNQLVDLITSDNSKLTDECKSILNEAISLSDKFLQNRDLLREQTEKFELWGLDKLLVPETLALKAEMYKKLDQEQQEKLSWTKAAEETLKLNPNVNNPTLIIFLVHYLKNYESLKNIEPWIEKLELKYPTEHTYFQRHAQLLFDKKEFTRSLIIAEKAHSLAYGANKFRTGLLLAKIQKELKKTTLAKNTVQSLLSLPEAKMDNYSPVVARIEKFFKTID